MVRADEEWFTIFFHLCMYCYMSVSSGNFCAMWTLTSVSGEKKKKKSVLCTRCFCVFPARLFLLITIKFCLDSYCMQFSPVCRKMKMSIRRRNTCKLKTAQEVRNIFFFFSLFFFFFKKVLTFVIKLRWQFPFSANELVL